MISADKIPNNVDLHLNKRLQRALEHWQPAYIQWWQDMGPQGFQHYHQVYVRTAISVDPSGWAHFEYVRLPEYRWGIFLADPVVNRTIGFGDFFGQPVWHEVPGEFRNQLRRLIVTQGDTEPASVEQQRWLGHRCPSLYDLRNLFQVNVEEGRHLWAMVYLLHWYFGRDGRDEAEDLLARQSGNRDKPRILDAFNEPIDNWLDFFMFTMFTDRDGKSQLLSLSESSLDPLSRTTRFMLTEEAHHMFVGETGVGRIIERTAQLMKEAGFSEDVRKIGGIDLPTIQKHINLWFSLSLDLHGNEISTNAAAYFANGLKGRAEEAKWDEHRVIDTAYELDTLSDGEVVRAEIPMRNAMNEILRDWLVEDCQAGVTRWNKILERYGLSDRLRLPDRKFNRGIGQFAAAHFDPDGHRLSDEAWARRKKEWLPDDSDKKFLLSIMNVSIYEPGRFANYIAPPARGVKGTPINFEVRQDGDLMDGRSSKVEYRAADGVAVLTLIEPPANTYSYEMMRDLDAAILDARMDSTVHVIVIIGAGDKFFCAGATIGMLKDADPDFKYFFCLHANETLNRLEQTPKLVIAALNGHTVGGGLEVAMAADLRIARTDGGKIGLPEVALGVLPGTGGTQRLARLVGKARAMELMIHGRLMTMEEAVALGLVNEMWDAERLNGRSFLDAIVDYAKQFTPPNKASRAVGRIKRAVQSGLEAGFGEGLSIERELQQLLFQSEDAKEGIAASLEKRKPKFTGN